MFLEDIIPLEEREKMNAIEASENWSFRELVELSGLNPANDFQHLDLAGLDLRGEDLRGFNFSGSNLSGCLRNSDTIIDDSTILVDCILSWLDIDEPQIVSVMAEIEHSRDHKIRRAKLTELASNYRSPDHIRIYLRNLLNTTKSVDAFFDYLDFFDPEHQEDTRAVAMGLVRFSQTSVKHPGRTKKYLSPSTTSFKRLLDRISESKNPVAQNAFNLYLEKLADSGRTDRNPNFPVIETDYANLIRSIEEAGGQKSLSL